MTTRLGASGALLALAALVLGTPSLAAADNGGQYRYIGVHPMPAGGMCHIEAPHVHVYKPHKSRKRVKLMYRVHDGQYHFVGDPVAHGDYDGPRVAYYGHHPIAIDVVAGVHAPGAPHHVEYCYLAGPHHHFYAPPADLEFTVKGDAYWFVGAYPPAYEAERKALVRINTVYKPIRYERPVVEVEPPPEYHGAIWEVRGGVVVPVVSAGARVTGPAVSAGIEVHVPTPSLEVRVGGPAVIVDGHPGRGHGKYKRHYKHRKFKKRKHRKYRKRRRVRRRHWRH